MGLAEPVVRINVDAPRIGVRKDPALLPQVFDRLAKLLREVLDGQLTYQGLLDRIDEPSCRGLPGSRDVAPPRHAAKIIVLKEEQPGEHRVALTPRASADLVARGMRVWVESGAGSPAGYQDEVYIRAGATVTAARSELFQDADVITWVKPPPDLDRVLSRLPRGCTIVGFTHPLHDDTVARRAHRENLRVRSLELLAQEDISPAQDALAAMSRFAGRIALQEALDLRRDLGHRGPQNILVIGAGHAGLQAVQLASVLGHGVAVASTGQRHRREVEQLPGVAYYTIDGAAGHTADLLRQQRILSQVITVHRPGVIIAAAKHKGDKAPCLLPIQTLDRLPVGTVVVDLNTTRGGSAAGSQVDRQLQTGNGVWICHRSNYPNAEPAEASSAYAACLVSILSGAGLSLERGAATAATCRLPLVSPCQAPRRWPAPVPRHRRGSSCRPGKRLRSAAAAPAVEAHPGDLEHGYLAVFRKIKEGDLMAVRYPSRDQVMQADLLDAERVFDVPDYPVGNVFGYEQPVRAPLGDPLHRVEGGLQGPGGLIDGPLLVAADHHCSFVKPQVRSNPARGGLNFYARNGHVRLAPDFLYLRRVTVYL